MKQTWFLVLFVLFPFTASSQQFRYEFHDSVKVIVEGKELSLVGAGGTNSAQFNKIDLDADGIEDLVLFDRTNDKISTFLVKNNAYQYAPDYESLFPNGLTFWILLRDYDGDGKKDIFTASTSGIDVYRNVSDDGQMPAWSLFVETLQSFGFSGRFVNLKVDVTDIPSVNDIDGDGDLDILNFRPLVGGTVEFHKNMSVERYGNTDSLEYEKVTDRWGDFEECGTCNTYIFNQSIACRTKAEKHAGSALLALDMDGDGDKEMILGETTCENLVLLMNEGSTEEARFEEAISSWPNSLPINIFVFPAAFYEDLDFDGKKDLVVAPNLFTNEADMVNFYTSNWLYTNTGSEVAPEFSFSKKDFLQDEMIDVGEYAVPAFFDIDSDGDEDLFIGNRGRAEGENFVASISYFENIGSRDQPIFELQNADFANLSEENLISIKPDFADLNADGKPDLYFSARVNTSRNSFIYYLLASGEGELSYDGQIQELPISIEPSDEPLFYDLDSDGDQDLFLGKARGASLHYYENTGENTFVRESIAFGGIGFDPRNRELSIEIADLLGDGKPELIAGDFTGLLRIYPDFQDHVENGDLVSDSSFVNNSISNRLISPNFGKRVFPAAFGSDIALGSVNGGLHFLRNNQLISSIEDEVQEMKAVIYPNPAKDILNLESPERATVEIYSILGKKVYDSITLKPKKTFELDVNSWKNGVYVFRVIGKDGFVTKEVVIQH